MFLTMPVGRSGLSCGSCMEGGSSAIIDCLRNGVLQWRDLCPREGYGIDGRASHYWQLLDEVILLRKKQKSSLE